MDLAKHQRRPRLELKLRHHPDNLALYRESEDPVERSRWHAVWLLATGHSIPQVAQTLGYSTRWVRDTLHRYNEGKPMADARHQNPGQPPCSLQSCKRPSVRPSYNPIPGTGYGP